MMTIRGIVLQPGESGTASTAIMMHKGMEGPHLFEGIIKSNDPTQPETPLRLKFNIVAHSVK